MMTDEQQSKVEELRAAIATTAATASGAPQEVRMAALALKRELGGAGVTARVLAAALGIHETTLNRWGRESARRGGGPTASARPASLARKERGGGAGFRMVRLGTPAQSAASSRPVASSARLRVAHAPSGLVIDGLDVETLAALLRRMS
jgi:hypothetical protein